MKFAVAIGHFAQPSVIELQARVIRANCGDVPILVSDDETQTAFDESKGVGPERGERLKARLIEVCKNEGLILKSSGDRRLGHIGGDLGAFWHGLQYARDNDCDYTVKLSQRFVVDRPNWVADIIRQMSKLKIATSSRACFYHSRSVFHMRTEMVVMKTLPWSRPDILENLRPRELPMATEELIYQQIGKINGGPSDFHAAKWFVANRHQRMENVAWKDALPQAETDADYARIAAKYGVSLGEEFSTNHSCLLIGHRWGFAGRT